MHSAPSNNERVTRETGLAAKRRNDIERASAENQQPISGDHLGYLVRHCLFNSGSYQCVRTARGIIAPSCDEPVASEECLFLSKQPGDVTTALVNSRLCRFSLSNQRHLRAIRQRISASWLGNSLRTQQDGMLPRSMPLECHDARQNYFIRLTVWMDTPYLLTWSVLE